MGTPLLCYNFTMKNDASKNIFTEDLDYSQTSEMSIWGDGDSESLELFKKLINEKKIFGHWLNFAAGDGRYNNLLLSVVESLIATDIDFGALQKLEKVTPSNLIGKLSIKEQNITESFPFNSNIFDGVFNTGTLHLFSESILKDIFGEVSRVLKVEGIFIFDFATDVVRVKADGEFIGRSKTEYTKLEAKGLLSKLLTENKFQFEFIEGIVPPEEVTSGDGTYTFSCGYWIVIAKKIS